MQKIRVLFVCMGNICRSPLAHGLFEQRVHEQGLSELIEVDSAGTHAYHVGELPDPRSRETAQGHGIDLSRQRARKVRVEDFHEFDYILAMDRGNLAILDDLRPANDKADLHLFMEFAQSRPEQEVPDPYYGGPSGFERVYEMVDVAAEGLLKEIRQAYKL